MPKVLIEQFSPDTVQQTVAHGLDALGLPTKLATAKLVFIKPNLVTDVAEYITQGANTDARVVEAVLVYLERFPHLRVVIGESETGTAVKGRRLQRALDLMGVTALQARYSFDIVNLTHDEQIDVPIPDGMFLKHIALGKTLLDADVIINIPKIKTHKYATITCALKNMFGAIPDPLRIRYHQNIHQTLADLNRLFFDKMVVVTDGIIGMEGAGPLYGTRVPLNILLFAENPLVNDIVAAQIMGFEPTAIRHIRFVQTWAGQVAATVEYGGLVSLATIARHFEPAHKNLFIQAEGWLMQHPTVVKIIFNDWIRRHITYHFNWLLVKLRGGSYSWYVHNQEKK